MYCLGIHYFYFIIVPFYRGCEYTMFFHVSRKKESYIILQLIKDGRISSEKRLLILSFCS